MSQYWILVAILLPILGGAGVMLFPFKKKTYWLIYLEVIMILTSVIVWKLLLGGKTEVFHVVHFVHDLSISFKIDGLTMVFAGLVSILWPLATLYAYEYMEHELRQTSFFMFYSMTYGVT
ncbi:MAG: proton-conducting membrane transporter, partial [Lachnospiraceae bacterium]|nr:proton-conducting membrane transporter [Lachnospiraceae bacterium]